MTDIFDCRTMLDAVEQMVRPRTFLRDLFFNGANPVTFGTTTVDIDIVKGTRKMAPFVHPRLPGSLSLRSGYRSTTYKPPYIQPKRETTAELILKRSPGENPFATKSALQRAGEQLGKDLADLDDEITRREEWMCAQALTTGSINVKGEGVDDVIDFQMEDTHKVTLATGKWGPVAPIRLAIFGPGSASLPRIPGARRTCRCSAARLWMRSRTTKAS